MKKKFVARAVVAFILAFITGAALPGPVEAGKGRSRNTIFLNAMKTELERTKNNLKLPDEGFPPPYFTAYRLYETKQTTLLGKYGAIFSDRDYCTRRFSVEVRVGDYSFDNTSGSSGMEFTWPGSHYYADTLAPLDDDSGDALQNALWLKTDEKYKSALVTYHKKKGKIVYSVKDDKHVDSFSREKPTTYFGPAKHFPFNKQKWIRFIRKASSIFKDHPAVFDHSIKVTAQKVSRFLVNTEGTEIVDDNTLYGIFISASARAEDGMLLSSNVTIYSREYNKLPREKKLMEKTSGLIRELENLRKAPVANPYTGPAILAPAATGVMFHEAIGHRLEGHRQDDEKEGRTFKGQVGKKILPDFLSVYDNPTLREFNGKTLNGFYKYDDEGVNVKAQKVVLVDHGILRNFLMSRKPIEGFSHSNGHGRAAPGQDPVSRQGILIIEAHKSVPYSKLEKMLIKEAERQGKPYGLLLKDIAGGSTNTSSYGFQAFKGRPRLVYRIWVKDGHKELVRGVEMVGTPLSSLNKIMAASNERKVFNGYCGAESGFIPVSTIAPAILVSEIELQRTAREKERPPILPSPWQGK
ncbi:MAG: TldD/PmbA family protein [Deltaproteobacteria bacterium]|nr:TldD/PmbA family protein [Deltaproteobacteria bacterium]